MLKKIIMLKFVQKILMKDISLPGLASKLTRARKVRALGQLCGPVALIALAWATPVAPALAQAVPAGLLRLDPPPPQPYYGEPLAGDLRALGAYALMPGGGEVATMRSCMRFRSYDPASSTYLGRDGNRRPCL
jgi:hypothetical protein